MSNQNYLILFLLILCINLPLSTQLKRPKPIHNHRMPSTSCQFQNECNEKYPNSFCNFITEKCECLFGFVFNGNDSCVQLECDDNWDCIDLDNQFDVG